MAKSEQSGAGPYGGGNGAATAGRSPTADLLQVEAALNGFHAAFQDLDAPAMAQVWAQSPHVRCIHPGGEMVVGADEVLRSWGDIFGSIQHLELSTRDTQIEVLDRMAWATLIVDVSISTEDGDEFEASVATTNVFENVDGTWRMVLHHASNFVEDDGDDEDSDEGPRVLGFQFRNSDGSPN